MADDETGDLTRRNFIKRAGAVVAGAAVLGTFSTGDAAAATPPIDALLDGVSDLHVHADPDVRPRSIDELSLSRKAAQMGYRALLFKSHDWSTHDRAYLLRAALPEFESFGGLVLNKTHGDCVNALAAAMTLKTTGNFCRCIWMPTYQSAWDAKMHGKGAVKGIPVVEGGKVLPEVVKVMETCGEGNIIFATGHSAPEEAVLLVRQAKEVGLKKIVVTHASSDIWTLTPAQAQKCIDLGAYLEHSYVALLWGPGSPMPSYKKTSAEDMLALIRLAPERSFISSDLGQEMMPSPIDGMRAFIKLLLQSGFSEKEVDAMARKNPALLMGLDT